MVGTARWRTVWTLLGAILASSAAIAQVPTSAPADPLPGLPRPPEAPRSLMDPAPAVVGQEALPGPYFECDPLLDGPPLPQPGCFATVEIDPTGSHVKNDLNNITIPGNNLPNNVHLPSATLNWTVAPRFELGYRLPSGFGEFVIGYRFLDTSGNETVQLDTLATLHSRLDLNVVDFDYASRELSLLPHCDMKWRFGIRYASVFFDSQAVEPAAAATPPLDVFAERNSDSWSGVGPHVGLELGCHLGCTGWSFVGKTDFFIGLGRIRQGFFDVGTTPATTEQLNVSRSQAVPELNLQAGFGWTRPDLTRWSFFVGYQYDYWWSIGRNSDTSGTDVLSNGDMWDQGIVLRIECQF